MTTTDGGWAAARRRATSPVDVAWPIAIVLALATIDWSLTLSLGGRSIALPAPQLGVLVVAGGAAVLVVLRGRLQWDWLVVAYVALAIVPIVQARVLDVAAAGGTGVFTTVGLLLVAFHQYDVPDEPRSSRAVIAFATFGVVLACWMAVQWIAAVDDPGRFYDLKRSVSLPIGPGNFVAAALLVPILLVLGEPAERSWRVPALVVLLGGFAITLSRAGWLTLTAVLLVRSWLGRRDQRAPWSTRQRLALGGGLALILGIYLFVGSTPGDRLSTLVRPAVGPRLTIWGAAWDAFWADPVAGFGLHGFAPISAAVGRFETHPHSMVLTGFGMLGAVGGVLYVGTWVIALRRTWMGPGRATVGLATLAIFLHAQVGAWSLYLVFELLMVMLVVLGTSRAPAASGQAVHQVGLPWGRQEVGE